MPRLGFRRWRTPHGDLHDLDGTGSANRTGRISRHPTPRFALGGIIVRPYARIIVACLAIGLASQSAIAGTFTRLQVLLPGESAAPGTSTGKSGAPLTQTAGVPFAVTLRACDDQWNTATAATDVIATLASDASATLPPAMALQAGLATVSVTLNAAGSFTIYGHDQSDATIPDGASSQVRTLVLQGFVFSRITQKNQYAGTPMGGVTVTAVDPNGNPVTGYSGTVQLKEITSYGDGRMTPSQVTLSGGSWSGSVTMYRADETSINRGNVNLYAWIANAPAKNGTSDPFTVHPGAFARLQVVPPGQTPLPGSVSGVTGTPASQAAGRAFTTWVYGTDAYWNPVPAADAVRLTSSDPAANTPLTGTLSNGAHSFSVSLGTVGSQTLSASDMTNGAIQSGSSAPIQVIPSAADHFTIATIASPQTAGVPAAVSIQAVDASGNLVPNFSGDVRLAANTGSGSISPELVTFANGVWAGPVTFFGAGGSVSLSCYDFSSPPHSGTSNRFVVDPGPLAGVQVLVPGETAQGGTATGRSGTPLPQQAGTSFTLTLRAVDQWWNIVPGVSDRVALGSSDAFAGIPAETTLAGGQLLLPCTLYKVGAQRIWASDADQPTLRPDTSSAVNVSGGPFAKLVVLAPGESIAPGTATGRTGTATDESINYFFNVAVQATDAWFNPVGGVAHTVRITSGDPLATLPHDTTLVDGHIDVPIKLATGGFQQIGALDVTAPTTPVSATQVRVISSGFHLEAAVTPATARAGEPFTLTVKVTNDAGSVIQEIHSFITVQVLNAVTRSNGKGTLLTTQFQLLQGQRAVSETYTFAEPVIFVVHDDAGNAPGVTNAITITPGVPAVLALTSNPPWVGGNRHATLTARVTDAYGNGDPAQPVTIAQVTGTGTLGAVDSVTDSTGAAHADYLSARQPELDQFHATSGALSADLDLRTAFVDPNAPGGVATNYPNPFHPPTEGTTLAWTLSDDASVTVRLYTTSGDLVRKEEFPRSAPGGHAGLNTWVWDGRNGNGAVVASGGYIAFIEAQGQGETLHVIRRKIAVVR